ncbi:MAG: TAXI family TRAP transporter solute-binding subunit, partial [Acidobacteria bacterium]|nr:TAXI family TRAP transporter solute-binding subunit [Acidobacteriota bacterium]
NPILVDRGTETIALAQAATAAWAMEGDERAYGGKKYTNIRALAGGLNAVWQMALLRESYIERTGNDTLEKALLSNKPIRIVMKPNGSVVPILADRIFEAVGTSREEIVAKGGEIIQVSANQIPTLLRDGRADLYFESAIRGHPTITEVTATERIRFMDLPARVLTALSGPGLTPVPMPKWFEGQTGPTDGVDMGTVLIAHKDLPDDLAYAIARTVCENKDDMASSHKAWLDFDPRLAGQPAQTGIPLHPGAELYYREKGWYP